MAVSGLDNSTLRDFLKFVKFGGNNLTGDGDDNEILDWREDIAAKSERSIILLIVLLCLMSVSLVVFACWRKIYGDLPLIHLLSPTKLTPAPRLVDPPPPYTSSISLSSPLSLSDHLSPPPSYSRARELSESEDTFLPQEMLAMEDIKEIEDVEEEEATPENINTRPLNILCVNCLHRIA